MSRTGSPVDQFASDRAELNLLRPWRERVPRSRILSASLGSMAVHVALIAILFGLPGDSIVRQTAARTDLSKSVRLLLPKDLEVTQKDPNQGKVTRALDVRSMVQAPRPRAPRF